MLLCLATSCFLSLSLLPVRKWHLFVLHVCLWFRRTKKRKRDASQHDGGDASSVSRPAVVASVAWLIKVWNRTGSTRPKPTNPRSARPSRTSTRRRARPRPASSPTRAPKIRLLLERPRMVMMSWAPPCKVAAVCPINSSASAVHSRSSQAASQVQGKGGQPVQGRRGQRRWPGPLRSLRLRPARWR